MLPLRERREREHEPAGVSGGVKIVLVERLRPLTVGRLFSMTVLAAAEVPLPLPSLGVTFTVQVWPRVVAEGGKVAPVDALDATPSTSQA